MSTSYIQELEEKGRQTGIRGISGVNFDAHNATVAQACEVKGLGNALMGLPVISEETAAKNILMALEAFERGDTKPYEDPVSDSWLEEVIEADPLLALKND